VKRIRNVIPSKVYVIELRPLLLKVGRSVDPERRLRDFQCFYAFARIAGTSLIRDDSCLVENLLHKRLAKWRLHNECFSYSAEKAVELLNAICIEVDTLEYWSRPSAFKLRQRIKERRERKKMLSKRKIKSYPELDRALSKAFD